MKNARTLLPAMLLACLLSSCAGQAQPSGPARPKPLWAMSASDMFPNDPKAQALALAAGKGDIKEIDRLVAQGADVNVVGDRGLTIPYWVLYHPSDAGKKGFKRLLELGADPNKIRLSGKSQQVSLLHWTAYLSSQIGTDYLRMALEIGKGDPNLLPPDGKVRPIEMTLTPAKTEAFIVLYNAGAEINYKNKYGQPLVNLAASDGNYEIVFYLLQHGVDYISEYNGGGPKNIQDDINIELKCAVVARYPDVAQYMWFWRSVDFLEKRGMVFDFTPDRNSKPAVRPATLETTPPLSGVHERPRVQ